VPVIDPPEAAALEPGLLLPHAASSALAGGSATPASAARRSSERRESSAAWTSVECRELMAATSYHLVQFVSLLD
jgi:hypothetical protein